MWIELLDGHTYCMLPFIQKHIGQLSYYTKKPNFIKEFRYYFYIGDIQKNEKNNENYSKDGFEDHEDWSKFICENEKLFD